MTLRAIAIDDEQPALDILASHAAKVPFLSLQATFSSPAHALAYLGREPVDLVFLDIHMPDLNGLELMALAQQTGALFVFVTAHADYAVEGFRLQALDYLLKPVLFGRFVEACNRALQRLHAQKGRPPGIFVKDGHHWVRIQVEDIQFVKSDTNLLFIHHLGGTALTRMTIGELMTLLPLGEFIRVHKCYVVAQRFITKLERHQVTLGKVIIPIGRSYRDEVAQSLLGDKGGPE